MDLPKYLYHYTTLDSLALILKYKTIRFNKLTKTDDLEESMTGDLNNLGRYLFVSCWTNSDNESIPLWHMYSRNLSGVRIKLPFIPFKNYVPDYFNDPRFNRDETVEKIEDIKFKMYLPIEYLFNDLCHFLAFFNGNEVDVSKYIVQYTDDPDLLCPKVLSSEKGKVSISFGDVGKYKRKCWEFQDEWRYRIQAVPLSTKKFEDPNIGEKELQNCLDKISNGYEIPFDHIDLVIDDIAFQEMEITKGPGMSESQTVMLDAIVQKFNPAAKIIESTLKGKIVNK